MDHVHHADAVVDRGVHVPAHRFVAGRRGGDDRLTICDGAFEYVTRNGVQQRLSVGEVSVEGADPEAGAFGDRVARRFTASFEDELSGGVEEALPVLAGVSSHRLTLGE
ncbi:MAG: hypothetical protein R2761_02485 [Acidimicrobiales bacterium]